MSLRGARLESIPEPNAVVKPLTKLFSSRAARAALWSLTLGGFVWLLASGSIPCVFAQATHYPCPGCGSTRAVRALFHGDLDAALHGNFLGPVLAALAFAMAAGSIVSVLRHGSATPFVSSRAGSLVARAAIVVGVLEVLVWIARFWGAFGGPVPVT